ncbi:MAG: hypothetical protein IKL23_03160 [Oscillospiraceae bacterium]|nr:hypothetical protein [Oscillospiraceae bacterium]
MKKLSGTERKELAYRRDRILRWIETQGMVICTDDNATNMLKGLINVVAPVFRDTMMDSGLCAIFAYHKDQQPEKFQDNNAITYRDVTTDGKGTLYAIGIAVESLEHGQDWAILLFLHELCHVLLPDAKSHGRTFHEILDYLIAKYNVATGGSIENDYFGIDS